MCVVCCSPCAPRFGANESGFAKAILSSPHHMRLLWINAFSSLVWNRVASERVTQHGLCVVPGDYVIPSLIPHGVQGVGERREEKKEQSEEGEVEGEEGEVEGEVEGEEGEEVEGEVRLVTHEDVAMARYTPYHVVLMVPGLDPVHPSHCMAARYTELFAADSVRRPLHTHMYTHTHTHMYTQVKPEDFRLPEIGLCVRSFFRRLFVIPSEFSAQCNGDVATLSFQ